MRRSWQHSMSACRRSAAFGAEALVVALGLDAFAGDPFAGPCGDGGGFGQIAAKLATLQLPTVLVQEGGRLTR